MLSRAGVIVLLLAAGSGSVAGGQSTLFAGVIDNVDCRAELMNAARGIDRLPRGRGLDIPVSAGERVRCLGPGTLTLTLADGPHLIAARDGWVDIREGSATQAILKFSEDRVTRSAVPLLYSPAMHGVVRPASAVVRWRPVRDMGSVRLALRAAGSTQLLCCQTSYDGAAGVAESREFRDALRNYRARGVTSELQLTMRDARDNEYVTSFSILPVAQEKQLERRLARWTGTDGIVRHLGRASAFTEYLLMTEAAAECEAALDLSKNSPALIQLAARAASRADDIRRADELTQRLADLRRNP